MNNGCDWIGQSKDHSLIGPKQEHVQCQVQVSHE